MAATPRGVLRFSYGIMGAGKSTVALQVHHNLTERGLRGLLCTRLDREGPAVSSRLGISRPAVEVTAEVDLLALARREHDAEGLDFMVCDEVQFYRPAQVDQLAAVVDEVGVDVFAFGLLTDFRGCLFDGTARMIELADEHVPLSVEARCWCGHRATNNARLVDGVLAREGDTIVVGDTRPVGGGDTGASGRVTYELLCRRHFHTGELGP